MKKTLFIIDRGKIDNAYRLSILSSLFIKKGYFTKVILNSKYKNIFDIYKRFGISNFSISFEKSFLLKKPYILFQTIFYFIYGIFSFSYDRYRFINEYKIKSILIGDLIYDSSIRNNLGFLKKKINFNFIKILFLSIFKFLIIYYELKNKFPNFICLISSVSHATEGSFCLRISAKMRKKVIFHNYASIKIYRPSQIYLANRKVSKSELNKFKLKEKKLNQFLTKRFSGKTNGIFTNPKEVKKVFFKKKKFKNKNHIFKILKTQKYSRVILFSASAFSDAPHGGGTGNRLIFEDYYSLFENTIKFIKNKKNSSTLWIFKEHPSAKIYKEVGIFSEVIKKYRSKNIVKFPEEYDLSTLFPHLYTVITARGTMALEFATFGKKPIICGDTTFSRLGFTLEPKDKNEYFKIIDNFKFKNTLNQKQILNAKKTLYIVEKLINHSVRNSKIFFNDKVKALSVNEIKLEKKLRKINIKDIFNDNYYKTVEKFIKNQFGN